VLYNKGEGEFKGYYFSEFGEKYFGLESYNFMWNSLKSFKFHYSIKISLFKQLFYYSNFKWVWAKWKTMGLNSLFPWNLFYQRFFTF
jgi:hypothetical protein